MSLDKRLEYLERRLSPPDTASGTPPPEMVSALDELAAAKHEGREPQQWALEAVEPLREEK